MDAGQHVEGGLWMRVWMVDSHMDGGHSQALAAWMVDTRACRNLLWRREGMPLAAELPP